MASACCHKGTTGDACASLRAAAAAAHPQAVAQAHLRLQTVLEVTAGELCHRQQPAGAAVAPAATVLAAEPRRAGCQLPSSLVVAEHQQAARPSRLASAAAAVAAAVRFQSC